MTDRFEASTTNHGHPLTRRQLLGAAAAGSCSLLTSTAPADAIRRTTSRRTRGAPRATLDHSYEGGRVEYNAGACNGWLWAGANDLFPIGYYEASDLAFYQHAARYWTVCDHYFAATLGPPTPTGSTSTPARLIPVIGVHGG